MFFSLTRDIPQESSSSGDLPPEMMESETPSQASPPPRADDTDVSSQRISLGFGEVRERTKTAPEDNTSAAENMRGTTLMETSDGGLGSSDPRPDTAPEIQTAPESNQQPPSREERAVVPTATSTNAEAPNMLMDALQSASVLEEHRTLMRKVVEKIQSAKSGLNEAFTSLLTGFKVRDVMCLAAFHMKNMPVYR